MLLRRHKVVGLMGHRAPSRGRLVNLLMLILVVA